MSLTLAKTKRVIRAIARRKKQMDHFIITKYHLVQKKQFALLVEKKTSFIINSLKLFSSLFYYFLFFFFHIKTTIFVSYFSPTRKFPEVKHIVLFMSSKFMDLENIRKKFTLRIYIYVYYDGPII